MKNVMFLGEGEGRGRDRGWLKSFAHLKKIEIVALKKNGVMMVLLCCEDRTRENTPFELCCTYNIILLLEATARHRALSYH